MPRWSSNEPGANRLTGYRLEGIYNLLGGEIKAIRPLLKEGDAVMV